MLDAKFKIQGSVVGSKHLLLDAKFKNQGSVVGSHDLLFDQHLLLDANLKIKDLLLDPMICCWIKIS